MALTTLQISVQIEGNGQQFWKKKTVDGENKKQNTKGK